MNDESALNDTGCFFFGLAGKNFGLMHKFFGLMHQFFGLGMP